MLPWRRYWLQFTSHFSWRTDLGRARLMSYFAGTEHGAYIDVLVAIEHTSHRELRKTYLEHALDEGRHARMFRQMSLRLGLPRERAAMMEVGAIKNQGIIDGDTLFERLGEIEFLAFVHDAEKRAGEQFKVYLESAYTDSSTKASLKEIIKDEYFHISYSKTALEKYAPQQKNYLLRKVALQRYKERWLSFGYRIGIINAQIWLNILYFSLVAPFRLFAKKEPSGWQKKKDRTTSSAHRQY
jgi:rubrerythrin